MQPKHNSNGLCRDELARKMAAAFISTKLGIPLDQALERVPYRISIYWLETADFVIEAAAWQDLAKPNPY